MATSVVPQVIDALVALAEAKLPNVDVCDGKGVGNSARRQLWIGVSNPANAEQQVAATRQDWPFANFDTRDEQGEINCTAEVVDGDSGSKGSKDARDKVYAIAAALEDALRTDPTLGIDDVLWTAFGTGSALLQTQSKDGSRATLNFKIAFMARI